MKAPGQIALARFPNTDLSNEKLRPVLLLCKATVRFDDWLVCMVSSQLHQIEPELDDVIHLTDLDYAASGLKLSSAFRVSRLAVLQGDVLVGRLGTIAPERLLILRERLAHWLLRGGA